MHISETIDKNKKIFQIEIYTNARAKIKNLNFKLDNILHKLKKKFDLEGYVFLPKESSANLSIGKRKGIYVFEKKHVDIKNTYVKMDKIIEAAPVKSKEQKKQASLPYGLKKQAKPKQKKAIKKKTTEE